MDSQITLTTALVMIVLFSVAIIGFSIGFATDNDADISIVNDAELSTLNTQSKTSMETYKTGSESTYTSILDTTVEPGSDVIQSAAPFAITPYNLIGVTKSIIMLPYKKIFGSGDGFGIFFTTFAVFLVFIFGLLVYKTLRGSP